MQQVLVLWYLHILVFFFYESTRRYQYLIFASVSSLNLIITYFKLTTINKLAKIGENGLKWLENGRLPLPRPARHRLWPKAECGPQPCQSTVRVLPRILSAYLILELAAGTLRPWIKRATCFGLTGLFAHVRLKRLSLAAPTETYESSAVSPGSCKAVKQQGLLYSIKPCETAAFPPTPPARTAERTGCGCVLPLEVK